MPTRKDKTNVAPIHREQIFIPASGAVKFMQEFRKRTPRGGNLEIVSPEFDLLTGIRGISSLFNNVIGKKLPLNYAYRRASKQELDDIIQSKSFRKIPDNIEVEGGKIITLSNGKIVTFKKAKGNSHGGKAFSAGEAWKGTTSSGNKSSEIIIGVPGNNIKWKVGHHGSYSEPIEFNKISKGEGLFVPFDDNGVADISIKGLKQFTPTRFKNRYISKDIEMKCGGRRKAQLGLDIREGGIAIPIAPNMYYMDGRSHDKGGIAIGPNNKNGLEVEGGEVVKVGNNDIKVFSSVPLLRGVSPAQLVLGGANPNKVFKAQEEFKDRNRINDDGTRYEVGGEKIYTPSKSIQKQIQETGKITISGAPTIGGLRTYGYLKGLTNVRKYGDKATLIFRAGKELIKRGTQKLVDSGKINRNVAQIPRSIYSQFIGRDGQNLPKTISLINNNMEEKKFGGNMIYTINGNVKNGLSLRPKAEWGKGKDEYKWLRTRYPNIPRGYAQRTPYGEIYENGESYLIINDNGVNKYISDASPEYMDEVIKHQVNKRPQYYAKKELPLFGNQSIAEKAGLIRSGWSYADSPTFDYVPKINITVPTNRVKVIGDNAKKSTNSTPRRGESKSDKTSRGTAKVESPKPTTATNPNEARYTSTIKPAKEIEAIAGDEKTNQSVKAAQAVDGYRHKVGANQQYEDNSPDKYRYTRATGFKNEVNKVDKANETKTSPTGDGTQSKDGRWVGQYNTTNVGDWIGLGSNLAGSIASYFITKSAIDKMPEPLKPIIAQPVKLKTKYNIEPQLTNIREAEQMNRASVRRNTQSSNTSLAREQRLMNEARGARNTLYGQKENIETQLINQDRLNRQSVIRDSVKAYNEYLNKLTATKTAQTQLKVSNINNLISGLTGSVNNILGNIESRRATNNTLRAIAAANPNVDARLIGGFDYYIDPITKKKYNKNQQYVGTING